MTGTGPAAGRGDLLDYVVVDVFGAGPFSGNPLAVVPGADGLTASQMQALAREFNLSETSFLRAAPDGADYAVRIFTPEVELPFAGHPSVGAAWVLHSRGELPTGRVTQRCAAGRYPLDVTFEGAVLTAAPPAGGPPLDPGPWLAAVGLAAGDLAGPAPRSCGAGIDFTFLLVHDEAVARAAPDVAALRALGGTGVSVSSWSPGRAHARVFAAGAGVAEDPATGSAALGFGAYLAASGLVGEGTSGYRVEQGLEMGRPSLMECAVRVEGGRAVSARVGGKVFQVAAGQVLLPPP